MKRYILFFITILAATVAFAADEKWHFHPVDDPLELILNEDIKGEFLDRTRGANIPLVGRLGDESYSVKINQGSEVRVLARALAGIPGYVVETADGQRFITASDIPQAYAILPERYFLPNYIHYASDKVVGLSIDQVRELWGDYMLCKIDESENDGNPIYFYPQIQYVFDNYATFGTKLYADEHGVIRSVGSKLNAHRNLFGKLPFYKEILTWNLQEYVSKPMLRDSTDYVNTDPGFFPALLYGLLWILMATVAIVIVILAIHYGIKIFRRKGDYTYLRILYLLIAIALMYPVIIYVLQYYHNAWWVLAFFVPVCIYAPLLVIVGVTDQCPECHSENLERTTFDNISDCKDKKYPHITIRRTACGGVDFDVSHVKWIKYPVVTVTTCKDCGHRESSQSIIEKTIDVDNCPECGRPIDGKFWHIDYTVSGGKVHLVYSENCPRCGYHYESNRQSWPLPPGSSSAVPARGKSSPRPVPRRYILGPNDSGVKNCTRCLNFDSEYCNAYGLVGDGYRIPANKIERPFATICDHYRD